MRCGILMSIFFGLCMGIVISLKILVPNAIDSSMLENKNITLVEFKKKEGY